MALTQISSLGIKDGEVKTADIAADAVTSAEIANGTITNDNINASAGIALSKLASTPAVLTGSTDNTVCTVTGANAITGESNVHINGGYLIVGHTASTTTSNGEGPFVQIKAPDSRAGASFIRHSADAAGSGLYIGKSRNATIGSNTVVQDDDELGRITFSGDDGTDINSVGVEIAAHVDGTPGSNDMPGRLTFRTTADGASATTERMRINSIGNVRIGGSSDSTDAGYRFTLQGSANATYLQLFDSTTGTTHGSDGTLLGLINGDAYLYNREEKSMIFGTSNNERLRIKSDGKVNLPDNGKFTAGASDDLQIYHNGSDSVITNTTGSLIISDATETMYIQSDVGIRLTDVNGNENFLVANDNGSVELYHDGTKKFETEGDGVRVQGNYGLNRNTYIGSISGGTAINIGTSGGSQIGFFEETGGHDSLRFYTHEAGVSHAERMRISQTGKIGIGETAPLAQVHIKPATNITQLLLEQNNAVDGYGLFQDGPNGGHLKFMRHVNGTETQKLLLRNDGGLCFGTDSAAANALDDYEEGTFTPTTNDNFTGGSKSGFYVKVGQMVTCNMKLSWTGNGGQGGGVWIAALPFSTYNSADMRCAVTIGYTFGYDTDGNKQLVGWMNNNNNAISIGWVNDNAALTATGANNASTAGEVHLSCTFRTN